jgi:hypothetical protein
MSQTVAREVSREAAIALALQPSRERFTTAFRARDRRSDGSEENVAGTERQPFVGEDQLDRMMTHGPVKVVRTSRDTAKRKEAVSVLGAHGYH